jgi:mannitol-1-phosphate/altronate dehydrogenase
MKLFYVYHLKSTKDNNIFYIGKGTGIRMYRHVQIVKNNYKCRLKNPKLYNKIESIIRDGYEVIPESIFESYDEQECLNIETKKILEIGIEKLCNLVSGGGGKSMPVSEETKRKISESMKGRQSNFKGKKLSDESKLKMSLSHKDKNFSDEHCKNISKSLIGKIKTTDHINKIKESNIHTWKNKIKNDN